jgi:two-component system, chemotaxis family, response regulator Rcp1
METVTMTLPDGAKSLRVLLVEDSPTDVLMVREAMERTMLAINLDVVVDGVAAMEYLHAARAGEPSTLPDLILLDLNLPRKDGREVLSEIKHDQDLKLIPVVVLTSSKAEEDVARAYDLHANCYVTKPVDFATFCDVVRSIEQFWFTAVRLPSVAGDSSGPAGVERR